MANLYEKLPETPGVYIFKDVTRGILYVGKAGNLRRRVSSYFTHPHDSRIENLVSKIKKIDYRRTDTALEALILEAKLIKKYAPPFNVRERDDKSFLYVEISKESFPRILLMRGKSKPQGTRYGPFTSASNIREALRILRRIFPWSTHDPLRLVKFSRACLDYELGLCPGTCIGAIDRVDYLKIIKNLKLFFEGQKNKIVKGLEKEMAIASKRLEFEKAEKFRRQIFALRHIRDVSLLSEEGIQLPSIDFQKSFRIEGYDISNTSGTSAVGSMVVFYGNEPDRNEYRKFKIRAIAKPDDVGMLKEILRRRFNNSWPLPSLILIDGGRGQVNAAKNVLEQFGLKIPIVGMAKGPERKRNDLVGEIPRGVGKNTLINIRNEAHRFAISYHKKLRGMNFIAR